MGAFVMLKMIYRGLTSIYTPSVKAYKERANNAQRKGI